jgi:hypothetical protein
MRNGIQTTLRQITLPNGFKKLQKNTGALYTAEGQVIVAVYDPITGDAWFNDQSRGISGYISGDPGYLHGPDIWNNIFHAYNYNKYASANSYTDKGQRWVSWYKDGPHEAAVDIVTRIDS